MYHQHEGIVVKKRGGRRKREGKYVEQSIVRKMHAVIIAQIQEKHNRYSENSLMYTGTLNKCPPHVE
jgi:hypothetical protein